MPGTASWLALPLPAGVLMDPRGRPPSPAEAIEQLAGHLTTRGAGAGLIRVSNRVEALLSCPAGLTVWARYGAYRWEDANGLRQCPYADVVDAAEHLLAVMAPTTRR